MPAQRRARVLSTIERRVIGDAVQQASLMPLSLKAQQVLVREAIDGLAELHLSLKAQQVLVREAIDGLAELHAALGHLSVEALICGLQEPAREED